MRRLVLLIVATVGILLARVPARADDLLLDRFRDYLLALREHVTPRLPGVCRYVIAYVLLGPPDQRFYFDFSQPDDDAQLHPTRQAQQGESGRQIGSVG